MRDGLIERGAARSGDVLVLVRQRGPLFEAIIRALKQEGVAVAGADRLVLTEHIAVMDLMALADALLLPQDDLALATVLRSPLFGFSDDELFAVAWKRDASLRAALERKAGEAKKFADAAARLDELAQDARRETPFAFYANLLGAGGARKSFLGRLGVEANDALDEFLNLALDYERRDTPSLQGFVAWLRDAQSEVKRDMEIARDEVRVMTVHGAKGLEAPIVILADTMTPPTGPKPPRLLELSGGAVIWAGRKEDDVPSVAAARDAAKSEAENEYRRLLYVAMTRAADRLIICGADGRTQARRSAAGTIWCAGRCKSSSSRKMSAAKRFCGSAKRRPMLLLRRPARHRKKRNGAKFPRGCGNRRPLKRHVPSRCRHHRPSTKRFCKSRQAPAPRPIGRRRWSAGGWCIG